MGEDIRRAPGKKLEKLRTEKGVSEIDVASRAGLAVDYYNHLEWYDELYDNISLRTLKQICDYLGIASSVLFSDSSISGNTVSFEEIRQELRDFIADKGIPLAKFEDQVGWGLEDFVESQEAAWEWCVDCLRDVCKALGVDWISALPA